MCDEGGASTKTGTDKCSIIKRAMEREKETIKGIDQCRGKSAISNRLISRERHKHRQPGDNGIYEEEDNILNSYPCIPFQCSWGE
jgi:hypothetical protein